MQLMKFQHKCHQVGHHIGHSVQCACLAVLLSACGSAVAATSEEEEKAGAGGGDQARQTEQLEPGASEQKSDRSYIYATNFAGEPPANDMFSEPGHVFLSGFVPDGEYLFQVTDGQCTELLAGPNAPGEAPNTLGRVVEVKNGEFTGIPVAPFLTATRDNTGSYKVHMVPLDKVVNFGEGCYGFRPSESFTAEFSIVPGPATDPSYCVSGEVIEAGAGLEGIQLVLFSTTQSAPVAETISGADGRYSLCGLQPGEDYSVTSQLPEGYSHEAPVEGSVQVTNYTREDLEVQPFHVKQDEL